MAKVTDSTKKNEIALKALEKRNAAEKFHNRNQSSYPRKELGNEKVKEKEKSRIPDFFSTPFKQQVPTSSTNPASATPQDEQETGIAYSLLSHPVHENLLTTDAQSNCHRSSTVSKTLHEIFLHGDSALKYMQGASSTKMNDYLPLHLSVWYRNKLKDYNIRALKAFSKRSKEHMSRKQQKKCGSFNLPQELHKFNVFKPMHEMWECYMKQVLKNTKANPLSVAQSLLNADLHGAIILVAECKVKSFTGVRGIMIRETAETFGIITEDDKLRVVPKKFSVFVFQVYKWKITLHGDKLTSRNMGL